jgi:Domain of unknown function (DUF5615)
MALRFLADHCISNLIVQTLRDQKHEVLRLKDVLPVESPDAAVIAKAQDIDAILLFLLISSPIRLMDTEELSPYKCVIIQNSSLISWRD